MTEEKTRVFADFAPKYAALGWKVLPLNGKVPFTEHGFKDASDDPKQIEVWARRWPEANIGIRTGGESGIVVLDIDSQDGEDALRALGGHNPTPTARTGRGRHIYFKHPGFRVKNMTGLGAIAEGLELKGDKGYVVAPPSIHPTAGTPYTWDVEPWDEEVAEAPDWLLKRIQGPSPAATRGPGAASGRAGHILKHIQGASPAADGGGGELMLKEGERNTALFKMACWARAQGMGEQTIGCLLYGVNKMHTEAPLPEAELADIVRSAMRYPPGEPTGYDVEESGGTLLSNVATERVGWLWPGYIPAGKITILDGDPGLGKSLITLDIAARVTTGRAFPTSSTPAAAGGVVLCCAEDGIADTIAPRFKAAGGDPARALVLSEVEGGRRLLSLPDDIEILERAIERMNARLVVIDPVMAFISGRYNTNRDQDVRAALTPLARLAEKTGGAVILVRHLNKNQDVKALYRGGGSIGIVGLARAAYAVAPDPDDDSVTLMAALKMNIAPKPLSLGYRISSVGEGMPYVEWLEPSETTAESALGPTTSTLSDTRKAILDALAEAGRALGPRDIAEKTGLEYEVVKKRLQDMARAGQVNRPSRGVYVPSSLPSLSSNRAGFDGDGFGDGDGLSFLDDFVPHPDECTCPECESHRVSWEEWEAYMNSLSPEELNALAFDDGDDDRPF